MIDNKLTNSNIDVLNGFINTDISDHSVIFNILTSVPTLNSKYSYIKNNNENKIKLLNNKLYSVQYRVYNND